MPTSRRLVVIHRKNSPPVAHCSRTVAASSLIIQTRAQLDRSGIDDDEGMVDVVETVGPSVGCDDDVFEASAPLPREVDARLDREGVTGRERFAVTAHDVRVLVLFDADAVAGAMDE